jgi:HAD superfamily hydrolase (TIGR01549 family)
VETLFLDAGGVLAFPNWDRVSDTLARNGVRVSADALRRVEPAAKFAMDESRRSTTDADAQHAKVYLDLVLDYAGVEQSIGKEKALAELRTYHEEHNLCEHVPDDVIPALERLTSLGLRLVVASNANGVLQRMFERVGLARYFHTICDSWVEGAEKPDPQFFDIVLRRSGARPETTLHVGDLYHVDVLGARNSGLRAILIDPHELYAAYDVDRVKTLAELVTCLEGSPSERATQRHLQS